MSGPNQETDKKHLAALLGQIKNGQIVAETFKPKRAYTVMAVFGDVEDAMFMLIGEHDGTYGIFEAHSRQQQWTFHSGHSSLEGALDEIKGFNLRRIS